MALRVLLADESSTIKKVFQLALQDYAVDVRSVTLGTDVISIASEFQPDIIFADVLLQKQNGYEVSSQLRGQQELSQIPVVLMWSGFMDFDDSKYKSSGAVDRLEKPFDVKTLREIVQKYVPKTQSQILSKYLSFPQMPQIQEEERPDPSQKSNTKAEATTAAHINPPLLEVDTGVDEVDFDLSASEESPWREENFEPIEGVGSEFTNPNGPQGDEEFKQISLGSLHQSEVTPPPLTPAEEDNQWVSQDLSEFQLGTSIELEDKPPVEYNIPQRQPQKSVDETGDLELEDFQIEVPVVTTPPQRPSVESTPTLNPQDIERIVAEQAQKVIEKVVWQVVPELAKQIIEKELKKLLEEENELR